MWLVGLSVAHAQDHTTFEAGQRFVPTDEVLAALGAWDPVGSPDELSWGAEINLRLATDLECGALKVDLDVDAAMDAVDDLPQELAEMGTALASALPMLTLCHLSPSLCAEVKNLNLRIDQDLEFRAAMCQAIDQYIDDQADEGEQIRRDAAVLAEQQCITAAGGDAVAVRECTESSQSGLVTDIAKGFLTEVVATAPQKLVAAALDATNHELAKQPGLQELLSAVVGEAEIEVNGEVIPLLEGGSLTSEDIREALLYWGEHYGCSTSRLGGLVDPGPFEIHDEIVPYPSTEYAVDTLKEVLQTRVTDADLANLDGLPWATYRSFCMGLRNTASLQTAQVMHDRVVALTLKAEENPQLPGLGKAKLRQARRTTEAVVTALGADAQVMSFGDWSMALAAASQAELGHQSALAEALHEGEQSQEVLWRRQPPCNSYLECAETP